MSNKNEIFEYLIDQLRQQVNNSRSEDPAHEVQSLKNQLRDASAQIKELREDNIKKSEHISHLTGQVKELRLALAEATGDVEAYKLIRKGAYGSEQSGCRKEDTQECDHNWIIAPGLFIAEGHKDNVPGSRFCRECGKRERDGLEYGPTACTRECKHSFYYVITDGSAPFGTKVCKTCGEYF